MPPSVFASVVFLKVQDLARRPVSEQSRLRAQLEAVVAVTAAVTATALAATASARCGVTERAFRARH